MTWFKIFYKILNTYHRYYFCLKYSVLISNADTLCHIITSPPNSVTNGACGNGWVCEHRWSTVADMIQFSNAVAGEPLTNWQVLFDI